MRAPIGSSIAGARAARDGAVSRVREVAAEPESAPAWEEGTLAEVVAAAARVRHAPALELSVAAGAGASCGMSRAIGGFRCRMARPMANTSPFG